MAYDVFISYSSKDKAVTDAICARLESNGIRCWYAPRDILPGDVWADAIIKAIGTAKLMVLVYTDDSIASQQVLREVSNAVRVGIPIIPFQMTKTEPSDSLQYYLSTVHWLDAMDEQLDNSLNDLSSLCSSILAGKTVAPKYSPFNNGNSEIFDKKIRLRTWLERLIRIILGICAGLCYYTFMMDPVLTELQLLVLFCAIMLTLVLVYLFIRNKFSKLGRLITVVILFTVFFGGAFWFGRDDPLPINSFGSLSEEKLANTLNSSMVVSSPDNTTLFFAGFDSDGSGLFKCDKSSFCSGNDIERLYSGHPEHIEICGDSLVFFDSQASCTFLLNIKTKELQKLSLDKLLFPQYYDGILIYLTPSNGILEAVDPDGSYCENLCQGVSDRVCMYGGKIYLQGTEHNLYRFSYGEEVETVCSAFHGPYTLYGDDVYFSDFSGTYRSNIEEAYSFGGFEKITDISASQLLCTGNTLYFLKEDDNTLWHTDLRTMETTIISDSEYSVINIVNDTLYLRGANINTYEQINLEEG